jgi:hypothetical protein
LASLLRAEQRFKRLVVLDRLKPSSNEAGTPREGPERAAKG